MYPWNDPATPKHTIRSVYEAFRFYVPFTLTGALTLVLSFYLFIHGLSTRNIYELVLGGFLFLFWGILLMAGFWAKRTDSAPSLSWEVPEKVSAALTLDRETPHRVTGFSRPPLFFRFHFEVRGKLQVCNQGGFFCSAEEQALPSSEELKVPIRFPLSGTFQGIGYRTLRDVFGLVRISLSPVLHRSFPVLPLPHPGTIQVQIDPSLGTEEKRNLQNADEERYFMREYAPGDRFRDINWKTSSRLAFLITRIAPQSQEKTRILRIAWRGFGPSHPDITSLWALDRAKAWLFQFLNHLREEHPEFILRVTTPYGEQDLTTDKETEEFMYELVSRSFQPRELEHQFLPLTETPEELFVFSTAYDTGLASFLSRRLDRPTRTYQVEPRRNSLIHPVLARTPGQTRSFTPSSSGRNIQRFPVHALLQIGSLPVPSLLHFLPLPPSQNVRPLRGTVEIQTAEVCL
jgi:hypothetical protein